MGEQKLADCLLLHTTVWSEKEISNNVQAFTGTMLPLKINIYIININIHTHVSLKVTQKIIIIYIFKD